MASDQQGTGKHPHKSSEDPRPHHEAPTTSGQGNESSSSSGHRNAGSHSEQGSKSSGNESSDLKEREYRDAEGNVHHHTHTYEEQHKSKGAGK